MLVYNTAGKMLAGPVNRSCSGRRCEALPNFGNFTVLDNHVGILQNTLLFIRPDRRIFDQERFFGGQCFISIAYKRINDRPRFPAFRLSGVCGGYCGVLFSKCSAPWNHSAVGQHTFSTEPVSA
ncbi:hypothetical protein D3C87_1481600 [compost metagenome]